MGKVQTETFHYVEPGEAELATPLNPTELAVLREINDKVAAHQSLDEIMNFLFDSTTDLFPCDRISLAFVEEGGKRIVQHWTRSTYEPVFLSPGYSEDLHVSSLVDVLAAGKPRIISDLRAHANANPDSRSSELLTREGVRSNLTCPLFVEGRSVGLMFRSSRNKNAYNEHHVRLHLEITERLSQAVDKAFQLEQLSRANQAYMEMLGFISHELKNPLASIITDCQSLASGLLGNLSEDQNRRVQQVIGKANHLLSLIKGYLDLARVESGELRLLPHRVADLREEIIEASLALFRSELSARGMTVDLDIPNSPIEVECDSSLLQIVINNLLDNAIKYGKEDGSIVLMAKLTKTGLLVSVWNEGPGFPENEQAMLFRRFSRLRAPMLAKRKGTGVGLYTAWRIVMMHGGKIWARSEQGLWAEFAFRIPQPLVGAQQELAPPD